jgi:hypothetical protein
MANTLTSFNTTFLGFDVAALTAEINNIRTLKAKVSPLKAWTTVFGDIPTGMTTMNIPLPVYPTGSADLTSGPVFQDVNSNTVAVVVNKDAGYLQKFNPLEVQNAGMPNLVRAFLEPAIYGCERTLMSASLSQAIANTSNATSSYRVTTGATFSASMVASIAGELSVANIPRDFILVEPTRYWGLISNLSSTGNQAGADAIRNGSPNNPFGITVLESNLIPTMTGSTGIGTGNLVGLAGANSSVAIGTALPNVPHATGESFKYVAPDSGLTVLVENYFDESRRAWVIGASVLYGTATGVNGIEKITDKA